MTQTVYSLPGYQIRDKESSAYSQSYFRESKRVSNLSQIRDQKHLQFSLSLFQTKSVTKKRSQFSLTLFQTKSVTIKVQDPLRKLIRDEENSVSTQKKICDEESSFPSLFTHTHTHTRQNPKTNV